MIAPFGFVIIIVILDKERSILRQGINHTAGSGIGSIFVIQRSLGIEGFALFLARLLAVLSVKISLGVDSCHIVHGCADRCLDSGIDGSGVQCHSAPTADADDADFLRVNIILNGQKVYCCLEILGVYIRGSHIAGCSAAFSGKGRVKGQGQKAPLCHLLGIQSGGLLFDGTEGTANRNGRQFLRCIFWGVEITSQGDAIAVVKGHLTVMNGGTLRKGFIPFSCQIQLLFH